MTNLDQAVSELQKVLVEGTDFAEIMFFYFDHVAHSPELQALGKPKTSDKLMKILGHAAEQILTPRAGATAGASSIYIEKYGFYHGPCTVDTLTGMIFFFENMGKGMMMLMNHQTKHTQFLRLTDVIPQEPTGPAYMHHPAEPITD